MADSITIGALLGGGGLTTDRMNEQPNDRRGQELPAEDLRTLRRVRRKCEQAWHERDISDYRISSLLRLTTKPTRALTHAWHQSTTTIACTTTPSRARRARRRRPSRWTSGSSPRATRRASGRPWRWRRSSSRWVVERGAGLLLVSLSLPLCICRVVLPLVGLFFFFFFDRVDERLGSHIKMDTYIHTHTHAPTEPAVCGPGGLHAAVHGVQQGADGREGGAGARHGHAAPELRPVLMMICS
jgi:hypothetical protein